jgi:sulfur-oxidizing protein SoxY
VRTGGGEYQEIRMNSRREVLQRSAAVASLMLGVGLLPGIAAAQQAAFHSAAFDAKALPEIVKALGAAAPVESKDISVQGPDIAENGAVVPLGATTSLAGVKRMLLLVEKNPSVLSAIFDLSDAVEPAISTRVKMGQTSNVYAVAITNDNRVLFAQKEIKVTLGGCGG